MIERIAPKAILEKTIGKRKDRILALFSKRYKIRYEFSRLPLEQQIPLPHCITTRDQKFAYIKNSKAGCTTIGNLLYLYEFGREFSGDIHQDDSDLLKGFPYWQQNLEMMQYPNALKFSFVRQPEKRTVSAFNDFFVEGSNPTALPHVEAIKHFGFSKRDNLDYKFDVFLDYIQASMDESALKTDRHWRCQHLNIGYHEFKFSFIGKLENLDSDISLMNEMSNGNFSLPSALTQSVRNKSSRLEFTPSKTQRARIEMLYAEDYELFSY